MPHPSQQLHAIHAMLTSGHRNLRVERHSLWLWGMPAGVLFALSESILTARQLPVLAERALAWLALIAVVLLTVAALDWQWTRQAKIKRDEAWSFIHRQLLKVQWLVMGLATLTTFASFFFGGDYMICALWIVFLGLSLYLHGLFSEELLEWVGGCCILLGVTSLFARLPYETMRWLAVSVFAVGLPLLSLLLDRGRHRPAWQRLAQMAGWLATVLLLPVGLTQALDEANLAPLPTLSLQEFLHDAPPGGAVVIALPGGTRVPVTLELSGELFAPPSEPLQLPLTLAQPVELLWRDGELTGLARRPGHPWQQTRQTMWINIPWIRGELAPDRGPQLKAGLLLDLRAP